MQDRIGSVGNQFALTTLIGCACMLPVFIFTEGSKLGEPTQLEPRSSNHAARTAAPSLTTTHPHP